MLKRRCKCFPAQAAVGDKGHTKPGPKTERQAEGIKTGSGRAEESPATESQKTLNLLSFFLCCSPSPSPVSPLSRTDNIPWRGISSVTPCWLRGWTICAKPTAFSPSQNSFLSLGR